MEKIKCWEFINCGKKKCPAYNNNEKSCWVISDTLCHDKIQGTYIMKFEACLDCKIFNKNIDHVNIKDTLSILKMQYQKFRKKYDTQTIETEETSMELALGVSDILNALHECTKGNYSMQSSEESKIELISQLAKVSNKAIAESGNLIQELNSSILEFSNVFQKVRKGELGARIKKKFTNSHIEDLKDTTNHILSDFEKKVQEGYDTSMELALGLSENFEVLTQVSKGNFEVKATEEYKNELLSQLGKAINRTSQSLKEIIEELNLGVQTFNDVFKKVKEGELSTRVKKKFTNPYIQELQESINHILSDFEKKVQEGYDTSMELALGLSENFEVLTHVSKGNFEVKATEKYKNELLSQLGKVINLMVNNLKNMINQIKKIVLEITSSSTEISSTNEEIVFKANEEIKMVSNASTTITELTASIHQVANNAKNVCDSADKNLITIKDGYEFIDNTINKTRSTAKIIDETGKNLFQVQTDAQEIQGILNIINKISEKIDLLALNAAIEASGVGEAGRRFRVVADEMRKLADNSMKSSKQIGDVLMRIQQGIEKAGYMMKGNVKEVKDITNEMDKTSDLMKEIVKIFENTSNLTKEISIATNQQSQGTDIFKNVIEQISIAAQETVKGVENGKIAIENFIEISDNLRSIAERFKVGENVKTAKMQ